MAYKKSSKKKQFKNIDTAVAHVKSTFNNTQVSITTLEGDVILHSSAGALGQKGTRKGTPFAATQIGNVIGKQLYDMGIRMIEAELKGPGNGRDSVIRAIQANGVRVTVLRDVTPLPHNGCRAPKKRRV